MRNLIKKCECDFLTFKKIEHKTSSKLIELKEEATADKHKCLKSDRIMTVPCVLRYFLVMSLSFM